MTPTVRATTTQYAALEALARRGTMKAAAHDQGISVSALRHRLRKVRGRTRMTTYQLLWALGAGRVVVQDGFWLDAA